MKGKKNVKINKAKLMAHLGVGLAAAGAAVKSTPGLLSSHAGLVTLGIVFVAGTISPVALSANALALAQKAGTGLTDFLNAPKAARQAQEADFLARAEAIGKAAGLVAGTQAAEKLLSEKTGQFSVGELGGIIGDAAKTALENELPVAEKTLAGAGAQL